MRRIVYQPGEGLRLIAAVVFLLLSSLANAETLHPNIDRGFKAGLYARAGIAEYWIVDLSSETLEVHRAPERSTEAVHGWRYGSLETLEISSTITPLVAPAVAIPVAELLP